MRLLHCVNDLVLYEIFLQREAFPTLLALVSSVNLLVHRETVRRSKASPTLFTLVRLFSRVNALVPFEICCPRESFPTLSTSMRLLHCVNVPMFYEILLQ